MPRTCTGRPFARAQKDITRLVDVIDLRKRHPSKMLANAPDVMVHEDEPTSRRSARRIVCG